MRPDEITDERLDEALRRQPRWEPPPGFARAVVARMPVAGRDAVESRWPRMAAVFRAAGVGALGASLALAAGLLLSGATVTLLPGAVTAASASEMLLEIATAALVDNAAAVAWVSAVVTLSIAAAVTGRAQEWI
jgi:multisubunit Na+/H+ antiporter MnhB subunit